MVATQYARGAARAARRTRSGRAVAAAMLAMLVASLAPMPTAPAQFGANVYLDQGEAAFYQGNFHAGGQSTAFLDNSSTPTLLSVPVFNTGSELDNVEVWFFFPGSIPNDGQCQFVDLPAASGTVPGKAWANFTLTTPSLPEGGNNITLGAYGPPPSEVAACGDPASGDVSRPVGNTGGESCAPIGDISCRADANEDDNTANVYFVKNAFLNLRVKSIEWCAGDPATAVGCPEMTGKNVTGYEDGSFFEVEVENVGSWANLSNYGGNNAAARDGFAYVLNVTVTDQTGGKSYLTRIARTTTGYNEDSGLPTHVARSAELDVTALAGTYNVSVWLDKEQNLRRAGSDSSVDIGARDVEVAYRDFTPSIKASDFRTTAENPYPHAGGGTIRGNITFKNIGPAGMPINSKVAVRAYLDNLTSWTELFRYPTQTLGDSDTEETNITGLTAGGEEGSEQTIEILWQYSGSTTSPRYLTPGKHTIYAEIDYGGGWVEGDESNNRTALDIFIADATKPKFNAAPRVSLALPGGGAETTTLRPSEPFNVHIDVTDDDAALTVLGNFSLVKDPSVYRVVKANKTATGLYHFQQLNFTYHNFSARAADGSENWTLTVTANDSFGNAATGENVTLKLLPWPIHTVPEEYVIIDPDWPAAEIEFSAPRDPRWLIHVRPNMTGYDGNNGRINQQNFTENLAYNITTLHMTWSGRGLEWWTPGTPPACRDDSSPTSGGGGLLGGGGSPTCTAVNEQDNNTFSMGFTKNQTGAGPGLWNYSIEIKDVSGEVRAINGTLLVKDNPPDIVYSHLDVSSVVPSDNTSVNITGNFTDDSWGTVDVFLNFTRFEPNITGSEPRDAVSRNLSLPRPEPFADSTGQPYYNYTYEMPIGRGKVFGIAGKYVARLEVRDSAGNWNFTRLPDLEVKDEEAPRITNYGVIPANPEIGEDVTFWATASDTTNVTLELEVFRTSTVGELLTESKIVINQTDSLNYTYTMNFSREAVHAWRMRPLDGRGLYGDERLGSLTIRDNVGPRYDIRSPATVIDGTRYASGTPRLEIVLSDGEGVLASSIDLQVAGLPADFELVPAPGNVTGLMLVYQVPTTKKFEHLDVVDVNLTAQDNSSERLQSFLNFSFVVDDVAPTTRVISITPSYRDQPGHILNVSLETRFTLAAEDVDSIPTGVPADGIRYRILGGGPGAAETVYTGPFRIDDAPGVYTGPRKYTIQFWSEDAVGNFNRNPNVTEVYVDDTPPALFQFFPEGRDVNATFVDDRVGVNRSVVWYRLNDQPYVPVTLVEREGAWTVSLPEGVKGDRLSYYLQAWDRLDNTETFGNATNPYASFDVSNHAPEVRITAPAEGSRISRSVDLTWEASDEDGDALVYTVYVKAPGKQNFAELVKIENTGVKRYTIDTTRYPDGEYTFRIAAGDGGFVKLAETTVTILNRIDAVGAVTIDGEALPGESLLIKAEITKAQALVEARLYLGNDLVDSWTMNDEGREGDAAAADGIYSVRVPVSAAGDYRVEIFTRYQEDGETKESTLSSAATFSAGLTPAYILTEYGAILAVIGLLAAVGIGVAVFVVMRRR